MTIDDNTSRGAPPKLSWHTRLGWRHRGFRADRRSAKLILVMIFALPFLGDMQRLCRSVHAELPVDYRIFHDAATRFAANPSGHIYAEKPSYLYPPFFLTTFVWLTHIPAPFGVLVYQLAKWAALYASLRIAWRLCAPRDEDVPPIVAVGALLLMARYFNNEMLNGNINMLILFGVLLAAWLAVSGRHFSAGFVAAVVTCVKVTPALLLVYFVYKGWRCTVPGALLGAAVCLLLWPGAYIGWSDNLRLLGEWHEHIISGYVLRGAVYSVASNQSLVGLLNRMLGSSIAMEPDVRLNFVQLAPPVLSAIRAALSLGILATLAWSLRRRIQKAAPPLIAATEIALVQIAMLVLSGYTWKAHYVAMLLPYSALLAFLADARYPTRSRKWIVRLLILSTVLMCLSGEIVTPRGADYMQAYGVVLFSGIAAGAALLVQRRVLTEWEKSGQLQGGAESTNRS